MLEESTEAEAGIPLELVNSATKTKASLEHVIESEKKKPALLSGTDKHSKGGTEKKSEKSPTDDSENHEEEEEDIQVFKSDPTEESDVPKRRIRKRRCRALCKFLR